MQTLQGKNHVPCGNHIFTHVKRKCYFEDMKYTKPEEFAQNLCDIAKRHESAAVFISSDMNHAAEK